MKTKPRDWRDNIEGIDSLSDLDIWEVMIYMRHQFLRSAKDLCKCKDAHDREFGSLVLSQALHLTVALDDWFGVDWEANYTLPVLEKEEANAF